VLSQVYNRKFNGTFLTYAHTPFPYFTLRAPLPVQQPTDGMLLAVVTEEARLSVSFVMLLVTTAIRVFLVVDIYG
jgi:hypothetical protein